MYFNQKAIINNVQSHYQTNGMEWTLLLHLMMVSWLGVDPRNRPHLCQLKNSL